MCHKCVGLGCTEEVVGIRPFCIRCFKTLPQADKLWLLRAMKEGQEAYGRALRTILYRNSRGNWKTVQGEAYIEGVVDQFLSETTA